LSRESLSKQAINDTDYYSAIIQKIILSRESLSKQLQGLGWKVLPSGANFIFAGKKGLSGETIYRRLKEEGILVRLGWKVLPSGANFIFAGKKGLSGETIYRRLKEEGILVRYFNGSVFQYPGHQKFRSHYHRNG